jgi:hypothetical protein
MWSPVATDEATNAAAAAVALKDLLPISACAWADKGWLGENHWNAIAAVDRCAFKWSETARCGYRCWADLEKDKTQEQAWYEKAERETRQADWYRSQVAQRQTMAEAEELRK